MPPPLHHARPQSPATIIKNAMSPSRAPTIKKEVTVS